MTDKPKCARCGDAAESYDYDHDRTFWGSITGKLTTTTTVRHTRIRGTWFTRGKHGNHDVMQADEERPLCDPCWALFVGRFLQGRLVAALEHEHDLTSGHDGPHESFGGTSWGTEGEQG